VFVSLRRQHMWMCAGHRVAADTAITSGMVGAYTHTPTGRYQIQGLNRNSTLTLNTGATYAVKFWIPFDAPLFGFHDSSWQHFPYGSPRYRTAGSHGCVHMPLRAIRFLYDWADVGTPVRIKA
jgi:lipoprotein-anchoring transpeptidase ErfK/SrfK